MSKEVSVLLQFFTTTNLTHWKSIYGDMDTLKKTYIQSINRIGSNSLYLPKEKLAIIYYDNEDAKFKAHLVPKFGFFYVCRYDLCNDELMHGL